MVVHFKSSAHRLVTRINSLCGAVLLLLVRFVPFVSCAWIKLSIVGEGSTLCVSASKQIANKMRSSVNVVACAVSVVVSVLLVSSAQGAVQMKDFTSWACINSAPCLNDLAVRVARQLNSEQTVDLGMIRVQPIQPRTQVVEGRSLPSASFFDRNVIQIPFASWLINFEPSETKTGFYQVSVSSQEEGRSLGEGKLSSESRYAL